MRRAAAFILMLFSVMLVLPLSGTAQEAGPSVIITRFNETLLKAMKGGDQLGYKGRYEILAPVIKDSFALAYTARISMGRYWATLSGEERERFLKTYIDWTISTYAGRFDSYSDESFKVTSVSEPVRGTVTVVSKLIEPGKNEVEFHYQLRKVDDEWRIVDIRIEGVSQLALTRSQFASVLKKKGFNGLIAMLNDKIKKFSTGKEK